MNNPYEQAGVVIPTTTTTTCNFSVKGVELKAGDVFILPPGATIIAVSDQTKIVQNDCLDLSNVEPIQCYKVSFIGTEDEGIFPPIDLNWEEDNYYLDGVLMNNIFTPIGPVSNPQANPTTWISTISNAFPGVFSCWNFSENDEDFVGAVNGWTMNFSFKTATSIGDNLFFRVGTNRANQNSIGFGYAYVKAERGTDCTCVY